jgi:acetoin utilization deacetylase AcuC-like enzyme
VIIFGHDSFRDHDTGPHHPERPARLEAVARALRPRADPRRDAPDATDDQLARVHDQSYIARVFASIPATGRAALDADTIVSAGSAKAARAAAGAAVAAVDAVLNGEADTAFCAVRPPGHHAEPDRAMGFCLFNNAAVGALHALDAHGLTRVAIVDFDVHHGNGTQATAYREPRLFYASSHEWPLYPGTGARRETGIDGNVVNAPLPAGTQGPAFRAAYESTVLPALDSFRPELVILSAGFDAHRRDPLANLMLEDEDFFWVTRALRDLARSHAQGRVVSTLEGGYDLEGLEGGCAAHLDALT